MQLNASTRPFVLAALLVCAPCAAAAESNLEFDQGTTGWKTVLDGVMGGLSTGRIAAGEGGTLRFSGELSLENNGGFSQIRTSVPEGTFAGATGLVMRVKGDGRTYQCDIRSSRLRLMAGGYQSTFKTRAGEWTEVEIPFDQCVANSFGQRVRNAPALDPATIESIGVTLSDKKEGPFAIELDWIRPTGRAAAAPSTAGSLASVATKANLTTLLALVKAAGIEFPKDAKLTVFAPTNEAFAKLPAAQVEFLTSDAGKPTLQAILKHHVVAQPLGSSAVLDRRRLTALSGQSLEIDADGPTIDGARFVATDVAFDGGIVHVIDSVMLPAPSAASAEGAPNTVSGLPQRAQRAASILELAIERGVPRFNAGDAASCAALYELAIASVVLLGEDAVGGDGKAELERALNEGAEHQDASERAWAYRRAMDRALERMAAPTKQVD